MQQLDILPEKRFKQGCETVRFLYRGQMRGIEHFEACTGYGLREHFGERRGRAAVVASSHGERGYAQLRESFVNVEIAQRFTCARVTFRRGP